MPAPSGRRARREPGEQHALPPALPAPSGEAAARAADAAQGQSLEQGQGQSQGQASQPTGRRRRALAAAAERAAAQEAAAGPRPVFALPPAAADQAPVGPSDASGPSGPSDQGQQVAPGGVPGQGQVPGHGQVPGQAAHGGVAVHGSAAAGAGVAEEGRHDAVPHDQSADHTPPQPHPTSAPTGRRRRAVAAQPADGAGAQAPGTPGTAAGAVAGAPVQGAGQQAPVPAGSVPAGSGPAGSGQGVPAQGVPAQQDVTGQVPVGQAGVAAGQVAPGTAVPPQGVSVPAPGGLGHSVQAAALPGQALQPVSPNQPLGAQPLPQQGVAAPEQQPFAGQPLPAEAAPGQGTPAQGTPAPGTTVPGAPAPAPAPVPAQGAPATPAPQAPQPQPWPAADDSSGAGVAVPPNGAAQSMPPNGVAQPAQPVAPNGTAQPVGPNGTPAAQPPAQAPAAAPGLQAHTPAPGAPLPPEGAAQAHRAAQPLPAEAAAPVDPNSTQGRAISVRTLGQGVPFNRQAAQVQQPSGMPAARPVGSAPQVPGAPASQTSATPPPHQSGGSGRRRKLGTPPDPATRTEGTGRPEQASRQEPAPRPEHAARPHPTTDPTPAQGTAQGTQGTAPAPTPVPAPVPAQPSLAGQSRLAQMTEGGGRSYAIGAPDENAAEGPEPLDGPGGAVEVADPPRPQPMDDELPPEPLDNPRRLLVWPAPDVSTSQALSDRGYRPVIVNSREEVDAQIAAFPAALFVDPLTGPITRTALQSLRQAAVAAEVPVLVTAGLGQASRDAAYGADPAVLLKALAPRDSEQHPPRVLLIEQHAEIALALTATLERRGMQVARAASDADAVTLAGQFRPNLVVMDLMQVHRRQAGIVDWLRANGQLNRTPLVVYTAAVDQADLPRLASGETVLFLAERSTSGDVQTRIVELLSRIGTN